MRAYSQLNRAVRAPPTCRLPVGEGAKRTLICATHKHTGAHGDVCCFWWLVASCQCCWLFSLLLECLSDAQLTPLLPAATFAGASAAWGGATAALTATARLKGPACGQMQECRVRGRMQHALGPQLLRVAPPLLSSHHFCSAGWKATLPPVQQFTVTYMECFRLHAALHSVCCTQSDGICCCIQL